MQADTEVRSGGRLIRIVEMLATERRPLTAGEIASHLKIPQTTVHRLLATLVAMRWAERMATRLYRLGPGVLGTGGVAIGRSPLVQLARPVLVQVASLSGLASHLGVLVGSAVTYLAHAGGLEMETAQFKLGSLQPLHCTSAGKLLLALLPEGPREALLESRPLRSYTDLTITDKDQLRAELQRIRQNGYSADPGEYSEFWRSVAVPIHNSAGEAIAAITCGGRPEKMTVEHGSWMRQEMTVLAEELSGQLA